MNYEKFTSKAIDVFNRSHEIAKRNSKHQFKNWHDLVMIQFMEQGR